MTLYLRICRGVGGRLTSSGVDRIADRARRDVGGVVTVGTPIPWWAWWMWDAVRREIEHAAAAGHRIVLVSNSMGCWTISRIVARLRCRVDLVILVDATWNAAPAPWPAHVARVLSFHGTSWSPLGHDRAEVADPRRTRVENVPVAVDHAAMDDHPEVQRLALAAIAQLGAAS